ncbi:hypothetical protein DCC81_07935 [Chitinophaga parva]|uniref:Uncharacterized protein n=1 Tax=Chitinophaga parva TaxID=2169414 RepID=A0A2T7BNY0_9BACT|nr:hypothetical protein [Chitinophaga parva]PUZ29372.1 hypothetical protein DCC81_07935 [Chitinophaga parva]
MQTMNLGPVIIVGVLVLALLVFLILRNKKDRREVMPPDESTEDAVEIKRQEDEIRRDRL